MDKNTSQSKLFTRGGQITFNNLRMLTQVNQKIVHGCLLLIVLMTLAGLWIMTPFETIKATYYYVSAILFEARVCTARISLHLAWKADSR